MEIIKTSINDIETIIVQTNKFKNITISVIFEGEFDANTATAKSLLQKVLMTSTKKYPEKSTIIHKLFDLYDCSITCATVPSYKMIATIFTLDIIDYHLVNDDKLFKEAIIFFKEFIFNPNVINDAFEQKHFDEEKRLVRQKMEKIYENKNRYAIRKMLEVMCENEIVSIPTNGTIAILDTITPEYLFSVYKKMITEEKVKFLVTGALDINTVNQYLSWIGEFKVNEQSFEIYDKSVHHVSKVKEIEEIQNINQSKLAMGFRTNIGAKDKLKNASILFTMMFGGLYVSDLVKTIREEMSLAYSITASIFPVNKIMLVTAGIDAKNYHQVTDTVIKELQRYKDGEIDENLLETAKEFIISDTIQLVDHPNDIADYYYRDSLYESNLSLEKLIDELSNVTVKDIQKVADSIELDTIYFLRGEQS